MAKVSIVVPVYNAEKYLNRCISSLVNQTEKDIEIILVDDASKDNSLFICNEFQKLDNRIKVISKENGGPHSARKMGVHYATCEWITFVDADDWIEADLIRNMLHRVTKNMCDIIVTAVTCDNEQESLISENEIPSGLYKDSNLVECVYKKMLCDNHSFSQKLIPALHGKLFSRIPLEKIVDKLDEDIAMGEDLACTIEFVLHSKVVQIDNEICGYHYVINKNSLTYRYDSKYYDKSSRLYAFLDRVLKQYQVEYLSENFNRYKVYLVYRQLGILVCASQYDDYTKMLEELRAVCANQTIMSAIQSCKIRKLEIRLMPKLVLLCMQHKRIRLMKVICNVWYTLTIIRKRGSVEDTIQ